MKNKRELRVEMRERRKAVAAAERERRGALAQSRVLASPQFASAAAVAVYMAHGSETGTELILAAAQRAGKRLALPCSSADGRHYHFAWLETGTRMTPGAHGIVEPCDAAPAAPRAIDLAVIPGLAFTRSGLRLGQGGGNYDRLLADCPAIKIGLAFGCQLLDELPREDHDVLMDYIATENEFIECESARNNEKTARGDPVEK